MQQSMNIEKDTFRFWFPAEIEKAGDSDKVDYSNMILKGIASTDDEDTDGQEMLNDGFDIDYLLNRGFINWHHGSKTSPMAIIGEPEEAKVTSKGLFIKAKLYDTPVAREAYDLARVLAQQSTKRKLGWSIEGKVIEQEGNVIKKAKVTGVALTHSPKNSHTFADICKAMTDGTTTSDLLKEDSGSNTFTIETPNGKIIVKGGDVKYLEKAMEADSTGAPLKKESLEGGKKLKRVTHSAAIEKILNKYPDISFEKACKVYKQILKNRKNKRS